MNWICLEGVEGHWAYINADNMLAIDVRSYQTTLNPPQRRAQVVISGVGGPFFGPDEEIEQANERRDRIMRAVLGQHRSTSTIPHV